MSGKSKYYPVNHPAVAGSSCPVCLAHPGKACVVGVYGTQPARGTHTGRVRRFIDTQRVAKKLARQKLTATKAGDIAEHDYHSSAEPSVMAKQDTPRTSPRTRFRY